MPKIRKRLAIAVARNFAAGLVANAECGLLESLDFTESEFAEMQAEMSRIAERIEATINQDVLAQLGSREEIERREHAAMCKDW